MRHVRHIFAWLGGITFIVICLFVVAALVYRATAVSRLSRAILITHSPGTDTPETYGVPYHAIKITSHGRSLQAWVVDAGANTPAVLLFYGNGQTMHDFAEIQAFLFRQHVSSMSFDYSGFGASTGKATIAHLNQDGVSAWSAFAAWAHNQHPLFILGYSLGTGVVMHDTPALAPQPRGVILYGAFSSAKSLIGYIAPEIPKVLVALLPDVWDNVIAATRLRQPALVVAGMNDVNVPPINGRQIALFARDGSDFVLVPDAGHGGLGSSNKTTFGAVWDPILMFVRNHADVSAKAQQPASSSATSSQAPGAGTF